MDSQEFFDVYETLRVALVCLRSIKDNDRLLSEDKLELEYITMRIAIMRNEWSSRYKKECEEKDAQS